MSSGATKPHVIREQLIRDGCDARTLDLFVRVLSAPKEFSELHGEHRRDLERFKKEVGRVATRLRRIACDVEKLGKEPLFNGSTWEKMQGIHFFEEIGTPVPNFFREWPTGIRQHVEQLKQLRNDISKAWSPRSRDSSHLLMALWLYLREVTQDRITKSTMFALLGTCPENGRMCLYRVRGKDDLAAARRYMLLIKEWAAGRLPEI